MHSPELESFLADTLQIPLGTAHHYAKDLRAAKILSVGKQGPYGGAVMTETDCVNALLAGVIDHKYGGDGVAENVRSMRKLPAEKGPVQWPANFTNGLTCFGADNAGAALESILRDIRHERLAMWAAGDPWRLSVTIESRGGSVFVSLTKTAMRHETDTRSAIHGFARPGYDNRPRLVERNVTIGGDVFLQLAAKLGPPDG